MAKVTQTNINWKIKLPGNGAILISGDLVVINPLPNKFNPKMQLEYSVQVRVESQESLTSLYQSV